jgi:hypothetical protein
LFNENTRKDNVASLVKNLIDGCSAERGDVLDLKDNRERWVDYMAISVDELEPVPGGMYGVPEMCSCTESFAEQCPQALTLKRLD